jgi:hypothetical protein
MHPRLGPTVFPINNLRSFSNLRNISRPDVATHSHHTHHPRLFVWKMNRRGCHSNPMASGDHIDHPTDPAQLPHLRDIGAQRRVSLSAGCPSTARHADLEA